MNQKRALVLCLVIGISLTAAYFCYIYNQINTIPKGIYIGKLDIGGLTREEAKNQLEQWAMEKHKSSIMCEYEDLQWTFPTEIFNIDTDATLAKAFESLDKGNFFHKYLRSKSAENTPIHYSIIVNYNEEMLIDSLHQINEEIKVEPVDAYFELINDTVKIVRDQSGTVLDETKLREAITKALENDIYTVSIPTKVWEAERTEKDLHTLDIKVKVAEFSTNFNSAQRDRTSNIRLAAKMLEGHLLAPGDMFSFNDVVGERTGEKGYKEAPIFVQNDVVPGIGGGICQVSSTLYNLALLADLEIVERLNHSLPVGYVPLGRDATIDYNSIDLKFKNTTGEYLLLDSSIDKNTLTIRFFSSKAIDKDVVLYSETVSTISPPVTVKKDYNLNKGDVRIKQGNPGYQVKVWKQYGKDSGEKKILVSTDTYSPTPSVLYVGEKEKEVKEESIKIPEPETPSEEEEDI